MHPKPVIIVNRFGRMCNRLTITANLMAYCLEYGGRISNPSLLKYGDDFTNLQRNPWGAYPRHSSQSLVSRIPFALTFLRSTLLPSRACQVAFGLLRVLPFRLPAVTLIDKAGSSLDETGLQSAIGQSSIVFFYRWEFRCPDLVLRHGPAIRDHFRPVQAIETKAKDNVAALRDKVDIVVGVHIRSGDYRDFKGGRYHHEISQYRAWMTQLAVALAPSSVGFLVCSEAELDVNLFSDLTVNLGPGDPVGDLIGLSHCDRIIGPPSTFGQWAAFYGGIPIWFVDPEDNRPWMDRFAVSDLSLVP